MIRTRLIVGTVLAAAAAAVLVGDDRVAPGRFPCLFACLMAMGVLAGRELVRLFPGPIRPSETLALAGILLCLAANWYPVARADLSLPPASVWGLLVALFTATLLAAFLLEMYRFRGE